jgi:putative hydrolase of the HAD superfamily
MGSVRFVAASLSLPARESTDAVIFDAGGVLLLPDATVGQLALRTLRQEPRLEDWPRAYYSANLLVDSLELPDRGGMRRAIASAFGVLDDQLDTAVPVIEQLIASVPWVPVPGAVDLLRLLAGAGYKLAVVSNAFGTVERQLEQVGVCSVNGNGMPRVGVVIDSHVVGVEKPDARIFQLALDALGVEASRSVYVGDTVKFDVLGAEGAGLHPVHFDPFHLCSGGHSHISTLAELGDWFVPAKG